MVRQPGSFRQIQAALKDMPDRIWTLVCYDIRDPKRLRRVARLMEGYGAREQFSVFRCHLMPADTHRLRQELAQHMESEDSVLFVPLCGSCSAKIHYLGKGPLEHQTPSRLTIL